MDLHDFKPVALESLNFACAFPSPVGGVISLQRPANLQALITALLKVYRGFHSLTLCLVQ
jgi:hypothetical protein